MKRPAWATVIGIIGIIIGVLGLFGSVQTMVMPQLMEFQKAFFEGMQESMKENNKTPEALMDMMNMMWDVPEWFGTWSILTGIAAFIISGFYIFASISLLMLKRYAVRLFYTVIGVCIGFTVIKMAVYLSLMSFLGISMITGGLIGITIDVILLIVVITADKQIFYSRAKEDVPG